MSVLAKLRSLLEAEDGPLAASLVEPDGVKDESAPFGTLVARGQRAQTVPDEYELLVESILEGYLVHHGRGRLVRDADEDMCLLAGDYLYALGLARLARLGDLEAVAELGDLISLCSRVHALALEQRNAEPWDLTGALWGLSTLAVAGGTWERQHEARQQVTDGVATADDVQRVAMERAQELGLGLELERALIAFLQTVEGRLSA
jgi:hypothetical protein